MPLQDEIGALQSNMNKSAKALAKGRAEDPVSLDDEEEGE